MSTPQHTIVAKAGPADPPSPSERATQGSNGAVPKPRPRAAAGTVLCDRYQLEEPLGQGGVGAVWRATHTVIGKQVAIKLLTASPDSRAAADHGARLLHEAQALSRVHHPNVVDVVDHGFADDGTPFIAMELIEGQSLFEVLHGSQASERTWSWRRDLALQILDGLAACHDVGIVHRDVKPENIIVSPRSGVTSGPSTWVTLVDFGIALSKNVSGANPRLTREGSVFGTPMYMSPEQAAGGIVDLRTDIYAFGCVLHEMLSGQPPFKGTASQILAGQIADDPPALDHLAQRGEFPPAVLRILARCLAKDSEERFESARELHDALADPSLAETHRAAPVRRRRRALWATVGVGVGAAIALALSVGRGDDPEPRDEVAPASTAPTAVPRVDEPTPSLPMVAEPDVPTTDLPPPLVVPPPAAAVIQDETPAVVPTQPRQRTSPTKKRPRKASVVATPDPTPEAEPAVVEVEPAPPQPESAPPAPSEEPRVNELRNPFD